MSELIKLATHEELQLEQLENNLKKAVELYEILYLQFYNYDLSEFTDELVLQNLYQKSMKAQSHCDELKLKADKLRVSIHNKQTSIRALCQAILQIARQGISISYKRSKDKCPPGRNVYGESLKTIIWEARNQSIHHEEGNFKTSVQDCFYHLESEIGADIIPFSSHPNRNYSKEIIWLLGWTDYSKYYIDMISLLGEEN
nr:hypothetical protein [Bacilli bacterium]